MAFETFWTGRWAIFWKTTFSHNTEGKIYNDIPRFSGVELHVCKCLKTFLSLDTFYSFFFFNLSFTFYLVGGNILSLLSNVNPQNSSASVFTRVYTHERGYREQRILVVRNTKSQCIETDRLERSRRVSDNASNFLRPGRNFRVSGLAPVRFRVQAINSWVRSSSQKND